MARTINSILEDLAGGLQELKGALSPLMTLVGGAFSAPARAAAPRGGRRRRRAAKSAPRAAQKTAKAAPAAPAKRARKRSPASPKLKALRALQGRYMGAVRHLTAAQKAQVKKVRAESGYDAALKLAGSLGKPQG